LTLNIFLKYNFRYCCWNSNLS